MANPLKPLPITPFDWIANAIGDPSTFWARSAHAVYNPLHRNIGYFIDDAQLARGQMQLYAGETVPPPSAWLVKNALGALVPASEYLIKGKSLQPAWLSQGEARVIADGPSDGDLLPAIHLPAIHLPSLPSLTGASFPSSTLLLAGGGALALILILRRRR